jgi:hypothetical protein
MKCKLAVVVSALFVAVPAAAQIAITPTPQDDQTRPRRGFVTPEEQQQLEDRERQQQEEQGRFRTPDQINATRTFEGRATFSGTRPGKCPMNGSVRAVVRGSVIDASLTFPIERDAAHGFIQGTRFEAKGNFGYTFLGAVTENAITGTVVKRQTVKPAEKPRPGVPIPFLPGPTTSNQPAGPPLIQDCTYKIELARVS